MQSLIWGAHEWSTYNIREKDTSSKQHKQMKGKKKINYSNYANKCFNYFKDIIDMIINVCLLWSLI